MKFWQKLLSFWRCWKTQFFWIGHFEFFFEFFFFFFCFIPMKISHKLCVRMDGTQFLLLWWFTAKNECGNHKRAWVYLFFSMKNKLIIHSKQKQDFFVPWYRSILQLDPLTSWIYCIGPKWYRCNFIFVFDSNTALSSIFTQLNIFCEIFFVKVA